MAKPTPEQVHGLFVLTRDAVDAATVAVSDVHRAYAGYPYAMMRHIPPIAAPAQVVEGVQGTVTNLVYQSIRTGNHVGWSLAARVALIAQRVMQVRVDQD